MICPKLQEMLSVASSAPSGSQKTISSAFEPHMGVFIDAQDKFVTKHFVKGTLANS